MANYYGVGRTNYFAVKDEEAFRAALERFPVEVVTSAEHPGKVAVLDANDDGGGWNFYDDESEDDGGIEEDVGIVDVMAPHLADGQVAVAMEVGHEEDRYVCGYAVAFNGAGESREVSLSDIYALARDLGTDITNARQ
jgi:hypothetical protein